MTIISYIFSVIVAASVVAVVVYLLITRRLKERHALWWLVIGILMLVAAIFPKLLEATAHALGINLPMSLVFFVGIVVLFLVSVQHSVELTQREEENRVLAEQYALLEGRVRELESGQSHERE